jgi:hypothetical protein
MRIRPTLAMLAFIALTTPAMAQTPDCEDYSGVPCPIAYASASADYRSLVAVDGDLCAIANWSYDLQGWRIGPDGRPQLGGLYEPIHGHRYNQLAVHGDRVYGALGEFGVVIHQMIDSTPTPVDSILVSRSAYLVAVADDLLITNRSLDRLLIVDLAGPVPVLADSLDLPGLLSGGVHSAGGLVLVQTTSPPRAHVLDPVTVQIIGTVDIPFNSRTVSWDGRLAVVHDADGEETVLLDTSDPTDPVLRPLPSNSNAWLMGGTLVDGDLWLSGCDFSSGGILARFDMSDPTIPVLLGKQPGGGAIAEAVVMDGVVHALTRPIAMCADGPYLESTLIGLSDPLPTHLAYLHDNGLDTVIRSTVSGDLQCRTDGYAIQAIDFSDPTAPNLRGEAALPEHLTGLDLHATGTLVAVTGSGSGVGGVGGRIYVFDVSDPDAPTLRSSTTCSRFRATTLEDDRLYVWDISNDLSIWSLDSDGSLTLVIEHTNLTYDTYVDLQACGDLLFAIDDYHDLHCWDVDDPHTPAELSNLPPTESYRFSGLRRWSGGIYWKGILGVELGGYEMLTVTDGVPTSARMVWPTATDGSSFWGNGVITHAGDRLYLEGMGILAVDLLTEPPSVLGLIPASGALDVVNGYPVLYGYEWLAVWAPVCETVTGVRDDLLPVQPSLAAWPNPFNPRLTVSFSLKEPGMVDVAVFDLRGRRLRALTSGFREAGRHEVQWDGRDGAGRSVAAGVYVVRLVQAGWPVVRRVTMVK